MSDLSDSYFSLRDYLHAWEGTPFFPFDLSEPPEDSLLDLLYFSELSSEYGEEDISFTLQILWESGDGAVLPLLQAQGVSLVLGAGEATSLTLGATFASDFFSFTIGTDIAIRIDSNIIRPVELVDGEYQVNEESAYEVLFGDIEVTVDSAGNIALGNIGEVVIDPFAIGDTGLVIDPGEVTFCFGSQVAEELVANYPSAGLTSSFRGIFIPNGTCFFPEDFPIESLTLQNAFIGNHGLTGLISFGPNDDPSSIVTRPTAFGLEFNLESVSLEFVQNTLTGGGIVGEIKLPFFDDFVGVTLSLALDGSFYATLNQSDDQGLVELSIPNVATFKVSSLGLASDDAGVGVLLSGSLQLEVGSPELQWPAVDIQNLRISPNGEVKIPNGWLDFQEPVALDLYGFRMEISQIGFGNEEDGRRWIGFSGGVHLVDMLPTGASVEGLRVIWDPAHPSNVDITLQGVGLELSIPGVLHLDGDVALINEGSEHVFEGNATMDLLPLGIGLDASVKIGHDSGADFSYFYTFLGLQLPIGIPIWATGAAIYGLSGLYGMNVSPATTDGDWYDWYTADPKFDVTHTNKWNGQIDGRAFGAGMVLGTLFDAGRVVSAKALFAMVLPGPVILLNGKANVLQLPPELNSTSSEGIFNALAVLDAQAGNLQLNIDAGWSLAKVIDINASAEAYFDFANLRNWHFYLGQDTPEERRIRAYVISLFHADAYLMIDSDGIAAGFGVNWGEDWKFGPVKVVARAWIEAGAGISWQPPQLAGSLSVGGEFEISVAGFGVGLGCEAILSGKAPTLYWVRGELLVTVKLPVPIKDLEEDIVLEWKQEKIPPSDDPFKTIGLEHLKVDETWTGVIIPDSALLIDPGQPGYIPGPIVPLDARPSISFDRSIKDALTSVDLGSVNIYPGGTKIGDHTFDYELRDLVLEKWPKAAGTAWQETEDLYGAWMAVEDGNGEPAASKLQLWTKFPFEFTRQSSRTYRDSFLRSHLSWPCAEAPEQVLTCVDWESEEPEGLRVDPPPPPFGPPIDAYAPILEYPRAFVYEGLGFIVETPASVVRLQPLACGVRLGLKVADNQTCWILFPEPVRNVQLCLDSLFTSAKAYANGLLLEEIDEPSGPVVTFGSEGIDSLQLNGSSAPVGSMILSRICYETEAAASQRESTQEHIDRIIAGLTHWTSQEHILEPEMWYRLIVMLTTVRTYKGEQYETSFKHHAYFQTAGPPGLTPEWELTDGTPAAAEALTEKAYPEGGLLTDLNRYVQWAIPANGAAPVYRAYDVGVEFNEDYVEQMYGADMIVRLLDVNGLPIRDGEGNEVSMINQWEEAPTAELSETELSYVTRIEDCSALPGYGLPPNQRIIGSSGILLEEDFSGDLDQWTATHYDPRNTKWSVADGKLNFVQFSPLAIETLLVAGAEEWTDYAVEIQLGDQGSEVGIVFRYNQIDRESYYRLRLDHDGRHLERISNGTVTALWEDAIAYVPGNIDTLGVQCQGTRIRGQIDDELLFDLHDESGILSGKVGIYANSATATFEYFLVRQWPGGTLLPQTSYTAQLLASFVLFQGGLKGGWTDTEFAWSELIRNKNHLAAVGREDWEDYRLEVNALPEENDVGLMVRFLKHSDGTFDAYRLALNPDADTLRLVRLHGTYSGTTYETDASGRTLLWSCDSGTCGIDFTLTEHSLALSCVGPTLIVEVDGVEVGQVTDENPLLSGQGGLYYEGDDLAEFTDLIVRSAPRQPVYEWRFITSQFEGLVEQLDSFVGQVNREDAVASAVGQLADAISDALAGMEQTNNSLASARQALAAADVKDVASLRTKAQEAAVARQAEAAKHFAALDELLFESSYRPIPPIVEVTEVFKQTNRRALLLESPEPLDWQRLIVRFARRDEPSQLFSDLANVLVVWNEDGTKAFIALGTAIEAGEYQLHFAYSLDLGLEAPVLRRSGSTLPEVAALKFSLAS